MFCRATSSDKFATVIGKFLNDKAVPIQSFIRKRQATLKYWGMRRRVVRIQSVLRMITARLKFLKLVAEKRRLLQLEVERLALLELQRQKEIEEQERQRMIQENNDRQVAEELARFKLIELEKERQIQADRELIRQKEVEFAREQEVKAECVHDACLRGDIATFTAITRDDPDYRSRTNPNSNHCTIFHSAAASCSIDLLQHMSPALSDILTTDTDGNNMLHYAASSKHSSKKIETFKHLLATAEIGVATLDSKTSDEKNKQSINNFISKVKQIDESLSSSLKGVLKSGWLNKRGESEIWRKRWVVLTKDAVMYFQKDTDKLPRDVVSFSVSKAVRIEVAPGKPNAIDIYCQQTEKKKRSRFSLMAETADEILLWSDLIKSIGGLDLPLLRHTPPIASEKPAVRQALISSTNKHKENVIHLLSRAPTDAESDVYHNLSAIAWVRKYGCSFTDNNSGGYNPIHVSIRNGSDPISLYLASMGVDPVVRQGGSTNQSENEAILQYLAENPILQEQIYQSYANHREKKLFKNITPNTYKGFSYFTISILDHKIPNNIGYTLLFLTVI